MAKQTNISWTDHTFNPWIGCTKVSAECLYCYAETVARKPAIQTEWGKGKPRRPASADTWKEPVRWNEQAKRDGVRRKVFCASMADVFDPEAPEGSRARLFKLIRGTPNLDWLLLTKRPEFIREQLEEIGVWELLPLANVWIGFTAGDQGNFDNRWPIIREIPAVVRFCSYEPALGPITLPPDTVGQLDWLICGGETHQEKYMGRKMEPAWAQSIRNQSLKKRISFFFKQWGNWIPEGDKHDWYGKTSAIFGEKGELLDGMEWKQFPSPKLNRNQLTASH
jgi:protein gp37